MGRIAAVSILFAALAVALARAQESASPPGANGSAPQAVPSTPAPRDSAPLPSEAAKPRPSGGNGAATPSAPQPSASSAPAPLEATPQQGPELAPKRGGDETGRVMGPAPETPPPERPLRKPSERPPEESAQDRYIFSRVQDGYVRLDNRTGQVTFCARHAVGWACQLAPEDRAVMEKEIERLQEQNAALKREMLARGLPLPQGVQPEPPARKAEPSFPFLAQSDVDRIKGFTVTVWQRLVDLIVGLQRDLFRKG